MDTHYVRVEADTEPAELRWLEQELGLQPSPQRPSAGAYLAFTRGRLALRDAGQPGNRGIYVDLNSPTVMRRIKAGYKSPLARALGLHRRPAPLVLDACCGLGQDCAVLLGWGCRVSACERNPTMQLLLRDGLRRAQPLGNGWQGLVQGDAKTLLNQPGLELPDIVYIDPMFAAGPRKALPKLEMQMLRQIAGDDDDVVELIRLARSVARRRVVVKAHPRSAPVESPHHQVLTSRTRFDIYLTADKSVR